MCKTDVAVLAWLHHYRAWPPAFPRHDSLLFTYNDPKSPREEWGTEEWRTYALFLEESGARVMRDLHQFQKDLIEAKRKLSRRKSGNPNSAQTITTSSLLGFVVPEREKGKRGRKPTREAVAAEVLAIRAELESEGQRVTDLTALGEWFHRKGQRRSRARESRHLLNAVSRYRSNHSIRKR